MLGRRGFLGSLFGAAAVAVADPERLLWVRGQKLISIPSLVVPSRNRLLTVEEITNEMLYCLKHRLRICRLVNGQYDHLFAADTPKIGSTIQVRRPRAFLVNA